MLGQVPLSEHSWGSSFHQAVIGSAVVGGDAGAGVGHALGGMSRKDVKELGDELNEGQASLVVIGRSGEKSGSTRR